MAFNGLQTATNSQKCSWNGHDGERLQRWTPRNVRDVHVHVSKLKETLYGDRLSSKIKFPITFIILNTRVIYNSHLSQTSALILDQIDEKSHPTGQEFEFLSNSSIVFWHFLTRCVALVKEISRVHSVMNVQHGGLKFFVIFIVTLIIKNDQKNI